MGQKICAAYFKTLPSDVFVHVIEPFSRTPQPTSHMENVRDYKVSLDKLVHMYYPYIQARNATSVIYYLEEYSLWYMLYDDMCRFYEVPPDTYFSVTHYMKIKSRFRFLLGRFTQKERKIFMMFVKCRIQLRARRPGDLLTN